MTIPELEMLLEYYFGTTMRSSSLFYDPYGLLPAMSKAAIDAIPTLKVTEEGKECCICLENLKVGIEAKEMPCKHMFHKTCIAKWLLQRASCPLCRFSVDVPIIPPQDDTFGMFSDLLSSPCSDPNWWVIG